MSEPYKIGVFGSGHSSQPTEALKSAARQIGTALGRHPKDIVVITGGCSNLPYEAARVAAAAGRPIWGFSPVQSWQDQREYTPNDDLTIYERMEFVPPSFPFTANQRVCMKYRNVTSTATCDAGIIISGQ